MKHTFTLFILASIGLNSCAQNIDSTDIFKEIKVIEDSVNLVDYSLQNVQLSSENKHLIKSGTTLETRIITPNLFSRTSESDTSFGVYLRHLPLKPHGAEVMLYNGTYKSNYNVYDAVIDLEIGKRDLHQCADAVMRLWAEYLWTNKRYEDIHFNFTNGFQVDYSKWMQGYRVAVNGNKTKWIKRTSPSNSYKDFWKYMELVFSYAGTLSLSKELVHIPKDEMKIGDVFIWGGSPGHAILVIDMALNPQTKEKLFLLSQSYMPAQETQILKNPTNSTLSPWYSLSDLKQELETPEWNFNVNDLKRFK